MNLIVRRFTPTHMPKPSPEQKSRHVLTYVAVALTAIAVTTLVAAWVLLNRDFARGDKLQAQLNEFLVRNELPGRIDVFWYDNRVFVYSPVTDDRLPDLMAIIDTAEWVRDIDLRNTAITESKSEKLIRPQRTGRRVLTSWNSVVTPFLYD